MYALPSMNTVPWIVSLCADASHVSSPPALRHEYDAPGVRLNGAVTLPSRVAVDGAATFWLLSKTGTGPEAEVQGKKGPGFEFRYQPSQFATGGLIAGGRLSRI